MQPRLIGKPQCTSAPNARYRSIVDPFDINADLEAGLVFLFEIGVMTFLRGKKETVNPSKIGINPYNSADRLNTVHGGYLTVIVKTRLVLAANSDQLGIEIVEFGCKVRRRLCGHALTDPAPVNNAH